MMIVPITEIAMSNKAVQTAENAAAWSDAAWFILDAETQATMKATNTNTNDANQA